MGVTGYSLLRLVIMLGVWKFNASEKVSASVNDGSKLSWQPWSSRVQSFSAEYWEIFKPYGKDIDIKDTESVKNFTSTIVHESSALMDDIEAFLDEHASTVAGGRDTLLLMNLLDFYAGVYLHRFSRLIEVYFLMMSEIEASKKYGRQVHEYFFVANGFRIYFIKEEVKVEKFIRKMLTATDENVMLPSAYEPGNNRRLDDLARLLNIQSSVQKMDSRGYYIRPSSRLGSCLTAVPCSGGRLRLAVRSVWRAAAAGDRQHQSEAATHDDHSSVRHDNDSCLVFMFESRAADGGPGHSLTTVHERQRYVLTLPTAPHRSPSLLLSNTSSAPAAASVKCVSMSDGDTLLLHWGAWRPVFLSLRSPRSHPRPTPSLASTEFDSREPRYGNESSNTTSESSPPESKFPSLPRRHHPLSETMDIHVGAHGDRSEREYISSAAKYSGFDDHNSSADTENTNPIVEKISRSTFLIPRNVRSHLANSNSAINSTWLDEELVVVFSQRYTGLFSQWIVEKAP